MADIGVFHSSLAAGGGAEAVGAHAVAALLNDGHAVTLYTDVPVDIASVNDYHGTAIDPSGLDIHVLSSWWLRTANWGIDAAAALTRVEDMPLLRNAFADRRLRRYCDDHDLLFSTQGELFASDAVQYVHFPYYSERAMRRYGTRFSERGYSAYHRLCRAVKPLDTSPTLTLTNSAWTADVIEDAYGLNASVLHPPVRTAEFDPRVWENREEGFVAVGRVHHLKRQAMLIEIVDRLRKSCELETHLHVVGPIGNGAYATRVRQLADARDYVTLEGTVSRETLVELLSTHKYGLHGRRFEHFGLAVAEMVAAGMLPFVHRSGGQVDVVENHRHLTYDSLTEAVATIYHVMTSPVLREHLRESLSVCSYDVDRFCENLQSLILQSVE